MVEYGEASKIDFYNICWDYTHSLNFEEALKSDDSITQALTVIDKRLGKRRIHQIDKKSLQPLAKFLLEKRIEQEKNFL